MACAPGPEPSRRTLTAAPASAAKGATTATATTTERDCPARVNGTTQTAAAVDRAAATRDGTIRCRDRISPFETGARSRTVQRSISWARGSKTSSPMRNEQRPATTIRAVVPFQAPTAAAVAPMVSAMTRTTRVAGVRMRARQSRATTVLPPRCRVRTQGVFRGRSWCSWRRRSMTIQPAATPRHPVRHRVPGGQQQHRHPAARPPQLSTDLEAIRRWDHHVQHHGVDGELLGRPQRLRAGAHDIDGVPLVLQAAPQQPRHLQVVLDHEHVHHANVRGCA